MKRISKTDSLAYYLFFGVALFYSFLFLIVYIPFRSFKKIRELLFLKPEMKDEVLPTTTLLNPGLSGFIAIKEKDME